MTSSRPEMMSMIKHKALMEEQRNEFMSIIATLHQQIEHLTSKLTDHNIAFTPTPSAPGNSDDAQKNKWDLHRSLHQNRNTVLLADLVQSHATMEDALSDHSNDDEDDDDIEHIQANDQQQQPRGMSVSKNRLEHNRRVTSMIIEDLVGIEDGANDTDTESSSSSGADHMSVIEIEQRLLELQYQDIDDAEQLKQIIDTLSSELKNSRIRHAESTNDVDRLKEETIDMESELLNERSETQKYKQILRESQQLDGMLSADIVAAADDQQELDRVEQSKLDLIIGLSGELDKMRAMIKQQQMHIYRLATAM